MFWDLPVFPRFGIPVSRLSARRLSGSGIICGRGSFAALYRGSFPDVRWREKIAFFFVRWDSFLTSASKRDVADTRKRASASREAITLKITKVNWIMKQFTLSVGDFFWSVNLAIQKKELSQSFLCSFCLCLPHAWRILSDSTLLACKRKPSLVLIVPKTEFANDLIVLHEGRRSLWKTSDFILQVPSLIPLDDSKGLSALVCYFRYFAEFIGLSFPWIGYCFLGSDVDIYYSKIRIKSKEWHQVFKPILLTYILHLTSLLSY